MVKRGRGLSCLVAGVLVLASLGVASSSALAVRAAAPARRVPDNPAAETGLRAVSAVSSSDVWAVGVFSLSRKGLSRPIIDHWDGTEWNAGAESPSW